MAENKPTNRERLREITDGIEQGIKELFESEKYMRYLSVMSRFHRYSVTVSYTHLDVYKRQPVRLPEIPPRLRPKPEKPQGR